MNGNSPEEFGAWLDAAAGVVGAESIACLRMDSPLLRRRVEENTARVAAWLKAGKQGEMDYLARVFPEKADPWSTFPFARSVLVATFTNQWGDPAAGHPFPAPREGAPVGYISAYAREQDYHATGRAMLAELAAMLGEGIRTEAAVDTKAVYERLLATTGGLGVVGANDLLRVPGRNNTRGFIGCLFVDAELPEVVRAPEPPFPCAECLACVKNCPTGAIQFGAPIDARKCVSYLTIEKRSVLTRAEAERMGDWIFGCDGCTTVCPPRDAVDTRIPIDLEWLLKTPAGELRRLTRGNAVAYAGVTQLRKNAVALLKKRSSSPGGGELLQWVVANTGSELIKNQLTAW